MDELPYMAVCLAEISNNVGWKPTRRHRQTHISNLICTNDADKQYQRADEKCLVYI